jgi:predicted transcriptional regulator
MLITKSPVAVRTLSVRTDDEMYARTKDLAASLRTDPSTIMRVALANLLERAEKQRATSVMDLMPNAA